jgi:hypothetical protein
MLKNPMDKLCCEFCKKTYTRKNRSQHRKSLVCKAYQDATRTFNDLILTNDRKVKSFKDFIQEPFTDKNGKTIYLSRKQLKFLRK